MKGLIFSEFSYIRKDLIMLFFWDSETLLVEAIQSYIYVCVGFQISEASDSSKISKRLNEMSRSFRIAALVALPSTRPTLLKI